MHPLSCRIATNRALTLTAAWLCVSAAKRDDSRHVHVQPAYATRAADRALTHQGRAIAASALVAAWDRGVRLGVDEADDARRLTTDGGLGNRSPAGVKLRGCERHHGQ